MVNEEQALSAFAIYSLKRKKQDEVEKPKKMKKQKKVTNILVSDTNSKVKKKLDGIDTNLLESSYKENSLLVNGIQPSKIEKTIAQKVKSEKKHSQERQNGQGLQNNIDFNKLSNSSINTNYHQTKFKEGKLKNHINTASREKKNSIENRKEAAKTAKKEKKNKQVKRTEFEENKLKETVTSLTTSQKSNKKQITKKVQKKTLVKAGKLQRVSKDLKNTIYRAKTVGHREQIDEQGECHTNPVDECKRFFEWLIHPLKADDFFQKHWEKTPLQIKRNKRNYYKLLMSTVMLDEILRKNYILFEKNIDITSYTDGVRETHNPPGRALPSIVWDYYMNGCSVRMLNPQTFIPKLHVLNATLQEYFGCFVGANSYLTPPDSQGFAPHYDDIEAFILQIEGKKRWRLYRPRNEDEYLPRYSSKNFDQSEIGEPILDTILNAGELLYFPRGTIHQGETIDGMHSLHITLSVYQKNSYGDLLEKLLPELLKRTIDSDCRFREGLPLGYLRHSGFVHSGDQSQERKSFSDKVKSLLQRMIDRMDLDAAVDEMAKQHIHDFLPPVLTSHEQECSVVMDGERMISEGVVVNRVEIEPDTKIRLARSHCVRLVAEEGTFRIYYSTDNSKEYHEYELQFLEVNEEFVDAVKEIILRYPEFIRVEDLPIEGEDLKIQLVKDLWEKCIVVTEDPLEVLE